VLPLVLVDPVVVPLDPVVVPVVLLDVDITGFPAASSGCQTPPKLWMSCPFAVPGPLSPEKRYSGMWLYVTCIEPLGVLTVPSKEASTPVPACTVVPAGTSSGGHELVHGVETHVGVPFLSADSV
jgi:hypothetical protein